MKCVADTPICGTKRPDAESNVCVTVWKSSSTAMCNTSAASLAEPSRSISSWRCVVNNWRSFFLSGRRSTTSQAVSATSAAPKKSSTWPLCAAWYWNGKMPENEQLRKFSFLADGKFTKKVFIKWNFVKPGKRMKRLCFNFELSSSSYQPKNTQISILIRAQQYLVKW